LRCCRGGVGEAGGERRGRGNWKRKGGFRREERRQKPAPVLRQATARQRIRGDLQQSVRAHLALLVVLQQVLGADAARVGALDVGALQDVLPQLLAHPAGTAELALLLRLRALGAVAQEQQPALLLLDVLRAALHLLLVRLLLAGGGVGDRRGLHAHAGRGSHLHLRPGAPVGAGRRHHAVHGPAHGACGLGWVGACMHACGAGRGGRWCALLALHARSACEHARFAHHRCAHHDRLPANLIGSPPRSEITHPWGR